MYTLRDLASDKFVLLNEMNLVELEEVRSVSTQIEHGKKKIVTVHIGLSSYLFGSTLKNLLRNKVKKDLGSDFIFRFGI